MIVMCQPLLLDRIFQSLLKPSDRGVFFFEKFPESGEHHCFAILPLTHENCANRIGCFYICHCRAHTLQNLISLIRDTGSIQSHGAATVGMQLGS